MNRTMLGASVAVVCISSMASAANPPPKVAPVYMPPSYSWTGCYIGANAGGAWEKVQNTLTATNGAPPYFGAAVLPDVSRNGTGSLDSGGFIGGGQVGCNYQSGRVVWGVETDFDWTHQHDHLGGRFVYSTDPTSPYFLDVSNDEKWLWTVRGRIGVTATDRVLLYVTGGFAALRVDFQQTFSEPTSRRLRMERRRSRRSPRPKADGRLAPAWKLACGAPGQSKRSISTPSSMGRQSPAPSPGGLGCPAGQPSRIRSTTFTFRSRVLASTIASAVLDLPQRGTPPLLLLAHSRHTRRKH